LHAVTVTPSGTAILISLLISLISSLFHAKTSFTGQSLARSIAARSSSRSLAPFGVSPSSHRPAFSPPPARTRPPRVHDPSPITPLNLSSPSRPPAIDRARPASSHRARAIGPTRACARGRPARRSRAPSRAPPSRVAGASCVISFIAFARARARRRVDRTSEARLEETDGVASGATSRARGRNLWTRRLTRGVGLYVFNVRNTQHHEVKITPRAALRVKKAAAGARRRGHLATRDGSPDVARERRTDGARCRRCLARARGRGGRRRGAVEPVVREECAETFKG